MKPILLFALVAACQASSTVESLVSRLGPRSDYRSVEEIAQYRCAAVPFLVRQLEVVPPRSITFLDAERYPREIRVFWTIATLRYITNRDFYASRNWRVDPHSVRDYMLALGAPPDKTLYFGTWPSRGAVYFARPEEQREIIRQWREYSASGNCESPSGERDSLFWLHGTRQDSQNQIHGDVEIR